MGHFVKMLMSVKTTHVMQMQSALIFQARIGALVILVSLVMDLSAKIQMSVKVVHAIKKQLVRML